MRTEDATSALPDADLDLTAIRRTLESQLAEREEKIRELAPHAAPHIDPVAWASLAAARRAVEQITGALDRLAAGTYGRCIRCDGAILPARLEVLPSAATCIDCQNRAENA
ncbi:TraR/DksA family transcriptional regulator [Microbacterium lushaniae]|nr:TraR/DksA family transcriptional regulator [Microbacterium lushaniae]